MTTHSEVVRLNLEYYRRQAKALLKASKAGDATALQRLNSYRPTLYKADLKSVALHDAQLAIAREQGFPSWPKFKAFIVESNLDFQELVASFIDAAVSDGRRAREILSTHPKIADAGFYVALVLGDWKQVDRALAEAPALTNAKTGPQNCEPLLYVCFSCYANGKSERATNLVETAKVLLRHGADPNASLVPEDLPNNPLSCLYAATGLNNNPALARALLEAGADPNDSESLYHSIEHPDLNCMKLLLSHGAGVEGTNALKHVLDREDVEGLQLLLAAGANPDETNERGETALHWAVGRGRSAETITILSDRGVDLNAQRKDGRTTYALAMLSGQTEIADLLRRRGATTELSPLDQFVSAHANSASTQPPITPLPGLLSPGNECLLPDLASTHHTAAVRALLAAGMPIDARGEAGGTALHWACWKGYPDLVKVLLDHGASTLIEDREYHAPPTGWFHHGSTNCFEPDRDHPHVARVLIAAGVPMHGCHTPTGNPDVDAVLREHKLIE